MSLMGSNPESKVNMICLLCLESDGLGLSYPYPLHNGTFSQVFLGVLHFHMCLLSIINGKLSGGQK